jgi:hypothetical protein
MALNSWQKEKIEVSDTDHLMCSVQGCGKRWSVRMDGEPAFCSAHKWGGGKPAAKRSIVEAALKPPVQHWQDDEEF